MKESTKQFEPEHRFCPICDKEIKAGSLLHYCSNKKIIEIDKQNDMMNSISSDTDEQNRCFGDKLQEYEELYDNSKYYDIEEE